MNEITLSLVCVWTTKRYGSYFQKEILFFSSSHSLSLHSFVKSMKNIYTCAAIVIVKIEIILENSPFGSRLMIVYAFQILIIG